MPTSKSSGTYLEGTSSADVSTITDAGVYVLVFDMNDLANGEEIEVTISLKVLSGGTTRQMYHGSFANTQGDKVGVSIPIPVLHEAVFRIEQVTGTLVSIPWEVIQLDA